MTCRLQLFQVLYSVGVTIYIMKIALVLESQLFVIRKCSDLRIITMNLKNDESTGYKTWSRVMQ